MMPNVPKQRQQNPHTSSRRATILLIKMACALDTNGAHSLPSFDLHLTIRRARRRVPSPPAQKAKPHLRAVASKGHGYHRLRSRNLLDWRDFRSIASATAPCACGRRRVASRRPSRSAPLLRRAVDWASTSLHCRCYGPEIAEAHRRSTVPVSTRTRHRDQGWHHAPGSAKTEYVGRAGYLIQCVR